MWRRRAATPRGDYAGTIQALCALVHDAERELGQPASIGIGTPGAISAVSGNLKNSNSVWLNDQPLKRDLEQALGREVRLANDANCFVLSEAVDGAGAGADVVFGVILGTGVGGGIVVRHHVLTGANAIAGEWGHNPLPFTRGDDLPAPPCYCGQRGCIETYLSGPGMARDHLWRAGQRLEPPEILAAAAAGDGCRHVWYGSGFGDGPHDFHHGAGLRLPTVHVSVLTVRGANPRTLWRNSWQT